MRYVIVGGSAAGMAAATAIREVDRRGSILILSEESNMPYFRPMLPLVISGKKDASDLKLLGFGPYTATDIDIQINSKVEKVNTISRTLTIQNGDELPYDRLLIASGGRPNIPSNIIEEEKTKGVLTLRFLRDAKEINRIAKSSKKAVLLGAGLVNLKTALSLIELGLEVTLVEQEMEILPRLMEPDAGALIRKAVSGTEIKVMTGCTVTRVLSDDNKVVGVFLDNGQELPCELFCIGTGIEPNVEFLKDSGINVNLGVVADKFLRCNVTNVFAAGDVADTCDPLTGRRIVTGQWTNAVEMGRCAGQNMAGRMTEYTGAFSILNATQLTDVPFVSMGLVHTEGTDLEAHIRSDSKAYYKLVFSSEGSKLLGALFIGDISRAGLFRYIIREGLPITKIKQKIIHHSLHYGDILRG